MISEPPPPIWNVVFQRILFPLLLHFTPSSSVLPEAILASTSATRHSELIPPLLLLTTSISISTTTSSIHLTAIRDTDPRACTRLRNLLVCVAKESHREPPNYPLNPSFPSASTPTLYLVSELRIPSSPEPPSS